jgi:hypothetical protein
MANLRLSPPESGNFGTITVNGRTYSCALGSTIDVVDFDAYVMLGNGWLAMDKNGVGTTAMRPVTPKKGDAFYDTTVGAHIHFDGKVWRNLSSGSAV